MATPHYLSNVVENVLIRHGAHSQSLTVALSGGLDSMVLLDILNRQKIPWNLDVRALHVHHGLSLHAEAWTDFCLQQCAQRNIPCHIERVQINRKAGIGIEGAAREARYAAFAKEATAFIVAAQHLDDQSETVLHQMLRGTGLAGLAGMGEARRLENGPVLLRPFLSVRRSEIEVYAEMQHLQWVEDESNNDTFYMRNFIRHELAPRIETRFPHYREALARTAWHAAESVALLEALAKIDLQWEDQQASAETLDRLPSPRQINALYYWLRWHNAKPASHAQLEEWAGQLFRASPSNRPHQAGGHDYLIRRQQNKLIFIPFQQTNRSRK